VPLLPVLRFASLLALTTLASAQDEATPGPRIGTLLGATARGRLAAPPGLELADEPIDASSILRLLQGTDLILETFEQNGEGDLGLGFTYDVRKALGSSGERGGPRYAFRSRGRVAFSSDANPDDSLQHRLRARWNGLRSLGGGDARAERATALVDPRTEELTALDPAGSDLAARFAQGECEESLRADPGYRALEEAYVESVFRTLPPELAWCFDLRAGMESNQDFDSRQVTLGMGLGGKLVSWDPDARLSRWNLFDAPAAALRWLTGGDFRLSGRAWPSAFVGLDVVDGARDEARGAVTDDATFLRASLELATRSEVMELAAGPLALVGSLRFDQEVDAPAPVRAAGFDDHLFWRLDLELPGGFSLGYAAGTLPLDEDYDSAFSVGYRLGRP